MKYSEMQHAKSVKAVQAAISIIADIELQPGRIPSWLAEKILEIKIHETPDSFALAIKEAFLVNKAYAAKDLCVLTGDTRVSPVDFSVTQNQVVTFTCGATRKVVVHVLKKINEIDINLESDEEI